jgi:signal transduction histidine kinase/ActR/RegA family two-component response regulator
VTLKDRVVRFVRRTQLGAKLAWLAAGLTALVVAATVVVLSLQIRANTRVRFEDELRRNQKTFAQFQNQKLEQLTFAATLISQTASLPYALETYSAEAGNGVPRADLTTTVQRELERLVRESTKDILFVTDEKGRVFASAARLGAPVPVGTDLSRMREVQQALDVRERISRGGLAVLRQPEADFQVAVYPVEVGGYTLGTLVLGERLDSGFVDGARAAFDGYVVVSIGHTIASGTFPGMNDGGARALLASAPKVDSGPATVLIAKEEFVVAPVLLGETQDGAPVRMWLLQPLTETVRALTRPLVRDFLMYGVLAVLLAGFGAAVLARSVMRPFKRFVRYLQEGTAAERVEARFDAHDAPAEVRTLNDSFDELMDALHMSEAQLRQASKLEAVGTLAGGIAHDFNNLLTVITGFTELALSDRNIPPSLKEDLGQVISASERATALTRQLLAFSRKQVLLPTVLDLADVVEDVAPMLRRLVGEHIALRVERERAELTHVLVDRGQVEQVVINLVVNARDAMPRGGQLVIRVARTNGSVTLSVSDTGSGMPQEVRERIFEPFFTTKEPGKGTGLGLATVYGIVKQSGGTIDVNSTVGVGTMFTVSLPASDSALTIDDLNDNSAAPRGTETILLVEDEPSVRQLAQRALEGCGYSVIAAAGHADALALAARARVDLVLTDVVMPELGGPQVADRILLLQPDAAIVYMSGYADDALRSFDLGHGVNFLRKPFTTVQLARIVRSTLDARAAHPSALAG